MSWQTELQSWLFPSNVVTTDPPAEGTKAPQMTDLQIPQRDGKATILTFLRHCGCPFAEKTFHSIRSAASEHPEIHFVAISHSEQAATDHWLEALGGAGNVEVVVDSERNIYAAWGLGISSFWHILNPWSLSSVYTLGKQDGIWNRPTESGTRWQSSGSFAVDTLGLIRWSRPAKSADDVPDFEEALRAVAVK